MSPSSAAEVLSRRHMPIGAEVWGKEGVHARVWAPRRQAVSLVLAGGAEHPLRAEGNGYFSALVSGLGAGARYRLRLDGGEAYPDPASRYQPEGPHGPSQIVDPAAYRWGDAAWPGVKARGQVLYEMHIGTFTREGSFAAATERLADLAELGITVIELMPLADFPGRFGWGYDGVNLFAPCRLYGEPDDLRRFVDRAHALGLGVILDVVYNHVGPDGNYLAQFSRTYVTDRYQTEWGEAINYDGPDAGPVREFYIANAAYWIREFHLDGLRLDATQSIFDQSADPIITRICQAARAATPRGVMIIAENEQQDTALVRPVEAGGLGVDAVWNDDYHHSAIVALTGRNEAYYSDYQGTPQELLSLSKWGYLYQGQWYSWQRKRRGSPGLDLPPWCFVSYLDNHDQVANSTWGRRSHQLGSPARHRALTALLLLGPATPLLFQGQEYAASNPFAYFADFAHAGDLNRLVREGRAKFLAQFPGSATPEAQAVLRDPGDEATFRLCQLDPAERARNASVLLLHRDLIALRRGDPVLRDPVFRGVDGAVLGAQMLLLRFFSAEHGDRLLLVNLGRDLHYSPSPEPLLAPPAGRSWRLRWSSEEPRYGGSGTPPVEADGGSEPTGDHGERIRRRQDWRVPGEAAVFLVAE